jgi:hypothetical protein
LVGDTALCQGSSGDGIKGIIENFKVWRGVAPCLRFLVPVKPAKVSFTVGWTIFAAHVFEVNVILVFKEHDKNIPFAIDDARHISEDTSGGSVAKWAF